MVHYVYLLERPDPDPEGGGTETVLTFPPPPLSLPASNLFFLFFSNSDNKVSKGAKPFFKSLKTIF